ncbi:MAG: hypothetical protein K2G49_04585 [Muribaculum sp.]|nr:hypothetical protein [Muribaculum sp.]
MQCRGEWKLARGASADDVYVAASQGGYSVFSHGLWCGRPSSRPYSYAIIYRALSITIHAGNVGASGSSPALRPPMTFMWRHPLAGIFCVFAWFVLRPPMTYMWRHPRRGYSVFSLGLCCGRPSSRPYSYAIIPTPLHKNAIHAFPRQGITHHAEISHNATTKHHTCISPTGDNPTCSRGLSAAIPTDRHRRK